MGQLSATWYFSIFFLSLDAQQINLQIVCGWVNDAKTCLNPVNQPQNLSSDDSCPTVFKGYYCIPQTAHGSRANVQCPFYILQLIEQMRINAGIPGYSYDTKQWPSHFFHGYHKVNEEFYKDMYTQQSCSKERWGKFDRGPCIEAVNKHNQSYFNMFNQDSCGNSLDCGINKYDYGSEGNIDVAQNRTTDTSKEWEIQLLQYARMVLISGYAISLVATCLGSFIMIILRRLRCTRIYIHINLQISFMLRAGIWLFHDIYGKLDSSISNESTLQATQKMQNYFNDRNVTDYHSNMTEAETFTYAINHIFTNVMNPQDRLTVNDYDHIDQLHNTFCVDDTMASFWCRIYEAASHYFTCSNYFWFLVEGIYLKMLLQRAAFRSMSNIKYYLAFGWGFALIPTIVWAIVNLIMRPEVKCWLNDDDIYTSASKGFSKSYSYELITEVPIMISVLINVFIFISVVAIVGSKLRVTLQKSDYRYRLLRANLALIPLLGIHYVSTMFVSVLADEDRSTLKTIVNFINAITLSLQGLLVSIIYCFCNAEVQDELEKSYAAWKLGKDVRDDANRRRSTLSNSQSGTWWPGQGRRRSSMMTGRASFSADHRRSTAQTYLPSDSLISAQSSRSVPNINPAGTSTMRKAIRHKIQNMLNMKDDQNTKYSGSNLTQQNINKGSSLLSVPQNQFDENTGRHSNNTNSVVAFKTMSGIQEEPSPDAADPPNVHTPGSGDDEQDSLLSTNQRREGVLVMRPRAIQTNDNNNDSGYDEKD